MSHDEQDDGHAAEDLSHMRPGPSPLAAPGTDDACGTSWSPEQRPPSGVCPEKFCFHWVPPGGMADMTRRAYSTVREALAAHSDWTSFPTGGCACTWGPCTRLEPTTGVRDFYEPCDPELAEAGLPWFYFSTLDTLRAELHERFLRDASELWGAEALEGERAPGRPPVSPDP